MGDLEYSELRPEKSLQPGQTLNFIAKRGSHTFWGWMVRGLLGRSDLSIDLGDDGTYKVTIERLS